MDAPIGTSAPPVAPAQAEPRAAPSGVARALGLLALLVALGLAPLLMGRWRWRSLDARESFAHVFAAEQLPPTWSFGAAHALADGARLLELRRALPAPDAADEPAASEPTQIPGESASTDPVPVELLLVQVDGAQELSRWFPARPPPLGAGMGPGGGGPHGPHGQQAAPNPANPPASQPATQPASQPTSAPSENDVVKREPEQRTTRITLATGDLEWGTWRAAYVLERWVPSAKPMRESLRVNLSHAGRFAMLRANWAPGAKAVPAELVRLLEQFELRAGPNAELPSASSL